MDTLAQAGRHAGSDPEKTDFELHLTLLGIGGAYDADRGIANTAALLELRTAERVTERILIDCGHTVGRQLDRLGLTYDDIDAVLLSHAHGDHMDGLELYGYRGRYVCGRRGRLLSSGCVLASAWASLRAKMGFLKTGPGESRPARIDDYFHAEPVPVDGLEAGNGRLRLSFFPVPHVPRDPACGLRIELLSATGNGPVIRWSGDKSFEEQSPLFDDLDPARGDLVFHECLFEPPYETSVHTHLEELQKLPEEIRSSLVLIHHGQVQSEPEHIDGMRLGQPFQRFVFRPA